jgi:hypothetical protein
VYVTHYKINKSVFFIRFFLHISQSKDAADWNREENESTHLRYCTHSDIDKPVVVGVQYYQSLNRQTETGKPWKTDDLDTVVTVKTPHGQKEIPAHLL